MIFFGLLSITMSVTIQQGIYRADLQLSKVLKCDYCCFTLKHFLRVKISGVPVVVSVLNYFNPYKDLFFLTEHLESPWCPMGIKQMFSLRWVRKLLPHLRPRGGNWVKYWNKKLLKGCIIYASNIDPSQWWSFWRKFCSIVGHWCLWRVWYARNVNEYYDFRALHLIWKICAVILIYPQPIRRHQYLNTH